MLIFQGVPEMFVRTQGVQVPLCLFGMEFRRVEQSLGIFFRMGKLREVG